MNNTYRLIVLLLFFAFIFLEWYTALFTLSIILGVYGIIKFWYDKRQLKHAIIYIRNRYTNSPKGIEVIWTAVIAAGIIAGTTVLFSYIDLDKNFEKDSAYLAFIGLGTTLSSWYQKFTDSLRVFPEGIKLPEKDLLIPWHEVDQLEIKSNYVTLKVADEYHKIIAITDDLDDLNKIPSYWLEYKSQEFSYE